MNQHKKAFLLFFLFTFLVACCSVNAFATELSSNQTDTQGGQVITPEMIEKQLASSKAAMSKASSASSTASSRKTVNWVSSSSSDSSALSSEDTSSMVSSEESSEIVLPSVGSIVENNPLSSVVKDTEETRRAKWIGVISWACIALGVIVVLIVVFSNRRPPNGGPGRKRYRRPSRSRKKRLLNDKYYRNMR